MEYCKFCNRECKSTKSVAGHQTLCKLNPLARQHPRGNAGKKGWNNGLNKLTDFRVLQNSIAVSKYRQEHGSNWLGRTHSDQTKDLQSLRASERLQKNSKYSKNTEYIPGVILESSYEVRVATILDFLNIKWEKVRTGYKWNDNGKIRRYVPDFYLPEYNLFLDPKNDYLIKQDKRKILSAMEINNIIVIVLSNEDINEKFIKELLPAVAHGEQGIL